MVQSTVSNDETHVYSVGRLKNPAIGPFLLLVAISILFQVFQIWVVQRHNGDIGSSLHRLQNTAIWMIGIWIYLYYILSKASDKLPEKIEITSEGIARIERNGTSVFIRWDEIEKVTMGKGVRRLTIEAPTVRKRIFIPGHMGWAKEVVQRVLEEYQKRHGKEEPGGTVYAPTSAGWMQYWVIGGVLFFLIVGLMVSVVGLYVDGELLKMAHPKALIVVSIFAGLIGFPGGIYFIRNGLEFRHKRLIVNADGITQIDGEDSRISIRWNEIASLKRGDLVKPIVIRDLSGNKAIPIYDGYERRDELMERIYEEFMSHLKTPPFPVALGRIPVLRLGIALAFSILVGGLMTWGGLHANPSIPGNVENGRLMALVFPALFGYLIYMKFQQFEQVTLNAEGITLHRPIGKVFLPWGEVERVEWFQPQMGSNTSYILLWLIGRSGRKYKLLGDYDFRFRVCALVSQKIR